jgi:hypothetical protein
VVYFELGKIIRKEREMKILSPLSMAITVLALCTNANAGTTYSFVNITNNDPINAAIGENQLFLELGDPVGGQVTFTFSNTGPESSSIAQVYFDDSGLLTLSSIDDSLAGVEFSQGASPPELPGGNTVVPAFMTTDGLSFGSDPPVQANGVNPGEWLGITFGLDPQTNLQEQIASGALRIGIHVQAIGNGGSEAFILRDHVSTVPAPGAIVLTGVGVALIGLMGRQKALQLVLK